jgi:hypothetical protein
MRASHDRTLGWRSGEVGHSTGIVTPGHSVPIRHLTTRGSEVAVAAGASRLHAASRQTAARPLEARRCRRRRLVQIRVVHLSLKSLETLLHWTQYHINYDPARTDKSLPDSVDRIKTGLIGLCVCYYIEIFSVLPERSVEIK